MSTEQVCGKVISARHNASQGSRKPLRGNVKARMRDAHGTERRGAASPSEAPMGRREACHEAALAESHVSGGTAAAPAFA